jgi:hypothetical protein
MVAFAGAVICMVREPRPVRVRVAVGAALAIQLGVRLASPFILSQLRRMLPASTSPANGPMIAMNFAFALVGAFATGLLLWAAFTNDDRSPAQSHE